MSRRPLSLRGALAALACAASLLSPPSTGADTCSGLHLTPLAPATAGDTPAGVAVGDFNRDGRMDVAVANSGVSSNVSILLGNAAGGFTPAGSIPTAFANPSDIAAGDLDRDGILDLVVASGLSAQAQVLLGEPSLPPPLGTAGSFDNSSAPFSLNDLGANPTRIYLADYNRDGDLDLVALDGTGQRLVLYAGIGGFAFDGTGGTGSVLANIGLPGDPSGAAVLDFNRDGNPDLAVAIRSVDLVRIYTGDGTGALAPGPPDAPTGGGPRDIAAGDVNRDGWPDLATANSATGNASVLRNTGGTAPTLVSETAAPIGGTPIRIALLDLDNDAILDIAALDDSAPPRIVAIKGLKSGGPTFFQAAPLFPQDLSGTGATGLGVGQFTSDGRVDLVATTLSSPPPGLATVLENRSGIPCAGTSFARAPRAYAAGSRPVATAAADFDGDGRADLAVASEGDRKLRVIKNIDGHFGDFLPPAVIDVGPAIPTAVAAADLDADGIPDLVAALSGSAHTIQVFRGTGTGSLGPVAHDVETIDSPPSAVTVGDFNGDGIPDVAATSEGSGRVFVYRGDGLGGLTAVLPTTAVGAGPRALVAGFFNDTDTHLDLAVANATDNNVSILLGNGSGLFTPATGSPFAVGTNPYGIAAANIDGDTDTDLVTANFGAATLSVLRNDGSGTFSTASIPVPPNPRAVALVDLAGNSAPDIAVTSGGDRSVRVLTNMNGSFGPPDESDHSVRTSPRAITPIDADADGRLDVAVPCADADSIVVLLARPPGPPPLLDAPRLLVGVGDQPRAVMATDLDGDGDLDLAVANHADDTLSLAWNDGEADFPDHTTQPVGPGPESIVAGDFNRDGRVDLVLNASVPTPSLSILFGSTSVAGQFDTQPSLSLPGAVPDDLAIGDFDRDGDLDIAVCDKQATGKVKIVRNDGNGGFSLAATVPPEPTGRVGDAPTALVAVDLDRDGFLDLAVANDDSNDVRILINDRTGGFTLGALLALADSDTNPVSITTGDFDGDGDSDLAVAAFFGDRLHVYRNRGNGVFDPPVPFAAPATLQFVTAADLNLDGKPDLAAVAAGLVALRANGGAGLFEPPETWVAGQLPWAATVADLNRDGRPDAAIVNQDSDDVSLLLSTTCLPRRLDVTRQPLACGADLGFGPVEVEARDDGGNLAACATGVVKPSFAPGADAGADLKPDILETNGLALSDGVAPFTAGNTLSVDRPGRRYRLQFVLEGTPPPSLPPALSRSFTLGSGPIEIVGPASFCAPGSASYSIVDPPDRWDTYRWTLGPSPVAFTPLAFLENPTNPLVTAGPHTLGLTTRVDGCTATALTRDLYVGSLQPPVTLQLQTGGGSTVCVDCIIPGSSAKAVTSGGGALSYQWGYRTQAGIGTPVSILGETGDSYVLKGASFPGPGNYYMMVTVTPLCGPTLVSTNEWPVRVVDGVPTGEVKHLAATSRGTVGGGVNRLLWVNTTGSAEAILIRWNRAPDGTNACVPPANPDGLVEPAMGEIPIPGPVPMMGNVPHTGLVLNTAYCYSVFVKVSGAWSAGRTVRARPFNADDPAPLKWAYATGGTAVAPPTVSGPAILAMSNDRTVHALTRGGGGGDWPAGWVPTELSGIAHMRSPVVPFAVPLNFADTVLFAVDDSEFGYVHAINARTGTRPWTEVPQSQPLTGPPAGMFTQYGGIRNLLFVGTRDDGNPNELRALNLANGSLAHAYAGAGSAGEIGPILGMPAVDSQTQRVYFASRRRGSGDTLFCLDVGSAALTWRWSAYVGHVVGSPVLRDGRVIVGTEAGSVYSLDADDGTDVHVFTPALLDGAVKGFVFPDRRIGSDDLYFATETKVWSISDLGLTMTLNWEWTPPGPNPNPSIVLQRPRDDFIYVGSSNGELYELSFGGITSPATPPHKLQVLGGGLGQVGAPSLDTETSMLIVGSEPGVLYGVTVPFP